jgi:hypothetical protein
MVAAADNLLISRLKETPGTQVSLFGYATPKQEKTISLFRLSGLTIRCGRLGHGVGGKLKNDPSLL